MYDPELLVVVIRVFRKLGRRRRDVMGDVMRDVIGRRERSEHVIVVVDYLLDVDVSARLELRRDLLERAVLRLGNLAMHERREDHHQKQEDEERVFGQQLLQHQRRGVVDCWTVYASRCH